MPWTFRRAPVAVGNITVHGRKVTVRARSFFEARDLACLALKCGRDEIKLVGSVPLLSKLLRK